jgi:hypothetical protein
LKPIVISLCDYSGNAVKPWAEAGHECWIIDIKHPKGYGPLENNIRRIGMDIMSFNLMIDKDICFVFAFPPCTHLAISGRMHFQSKGLLELADSLYLVAKCDHICRQSKAPFCIENPISTLSSYWRKPDYIFSPNDFAGYLGDKSLDEAYTKRTCLWTGGGFKFPPYKRVQPVLGSKMHHLPETSDRAEIRSITPNGFARAVYEANKS